MSISKRVRAAIREPLLRLPLAVWERIVPRMELCACYHMVADENVPHIRPLFPYKTVEQFARDIAYLRDRYEIVDETVFASRLASTSKPRGRPALSVTFDDGVTECFTLVRPVLDGEGVKATFFVIADCVDNKTLMYRHKAAVCVDRYQSGDEETRRGIIRKLNGAAGWSFRDIVLAIRADRVHEIDAVCEAVGLDPDAYVRDETPYMTVEQIKELAADGHTIGAHGLNHYELQALEPGEVERQIVQSCEFVHGITGRSPVPFAVPFTLEGIDRGLLTRIRRDNPIVGVIYGTAGFKPEPPGLFNRFVADNPAGAAAGELTNLPYLMKRARLAGLVGRIKG